MGKVILASKLIENVEIEKEIFGTAWGLLRTYEDKKLSFEVSKVLR